MQLRPFGGGDAATGVPPRNGADVDGVAVDGLSHGIVIETIAEFSFIEKKADEIKLQVIERGRGVQHAQSGR
jgi:hypothetical protein